MPLEVRPVDPRDQRSEVWHPAYRVYFWQPPTTREFELTGVDAPDVLDWAIGNAEAGETFTVFACVDTSEGLTLVRLRGDGPTRSH